jgi:hypothetical protein
MRSYQAVCKLTEDGWWVAEVDVDEVRGFRVESPRLAFLPERVREALARLVDDAATAHIVLRVRRPY